MKTDWLIYGANGYTGRLIAERAKELGLKPNLGGRNREAVSRLANELGLPHDVFGLTTPNEAAEHLKKYGAVLHCAGPFEFTSPTMVEGCLVAKCNYLDITGEITVLDSLLKQSERFAAEGISVIPGVGFDVVPTDCAAAKLKAMLPDATRLTLAFQAGGRPSRGTMATMIEKMGHGSVQRTNGKLVRVPMGARTRHVRFATTEKLCVQIPWGDVASAFYSTGIPNVEVFTATTAPMVAAMKAMGFAKSMLDLPIAKYAMRRLAGNSGDGPSAEVRGQTFSRVWGEVENEKGERREIRLQTPNGYSLTVESSLAAVQLVIAGKVPPGAWTPSKAFGADFVFGLPGVKSLPN